MIRKWYSGIGTEIAKMTDVTDDDIRECSSGEVKEDFWKDDDSNDWKEDLTDTLVDPKIFGELKDADKNINRLGHIELPAPVVNVQYTRGLKPELPRLLGMTYHDLSSLIYYCSFIHMGDDLTGNVKLYNEKEVYEYLHTHTDEHYDNFITGANAVEKLITAKGLDAKTYILHTVPVMPLCMRFKINKDENGEICCYRPYSLNRMIDRVLMRVMSAQHIIKLNPPEVIVRSELRNLQEYVDQYISNGLTGLPVVTNGIPCTSLAELYNAIMMPMVKKDVNIEDFKFLHLEERNDDVLRIKKQMEEIFNKYDDFSPLSDEDEEKYDQLEKDLHDSLRPLPEQVLKTMFSRYEADYSDVRDFVEQAEDSALENWDVNEESLLETLLMPVYLNMKLYFSKRYGMHN